MDMTEIIKVLLIIIFAFEKMLQEALKRLK